MRTAFLPSVRASLNHSTTSCLRDCTMLLLAYGRNARYPLHPDRSEAQKPALSEVERVEESGLQNDVC
jgi:hypothetical protein